MPVRVPGGRWLSATAGAMLTIMLHDLDESLAALLDKVLAVPKMVTFDRPDGQPWVESPPAGANGPVLSVVLSHLDEDLARRSSEWADVRGADGLVSARQPPVRWMAVHYRVTAWAAKTADEHRCLGEVLEVFVLDHVLTDEVCCGVFVDVEDRISVACAPASVRSDRSGSPRPELMLTAVVPVRPALYTDIAPPAREIDIGIDRQDAGRSAEPSTAPEGDRQWTTFRIRETVNGREAD